MRKKISAKILVLVGVLFAAGAAGIIMGMILINSMNDKSQNISNECMQAVTLMADTQTSIEKVQKYANSSAAFRMQSRVNGGSNNNTAGSNSDNSGNNIDDNNSNNAGGNTQPVFFISKSIFCNTCSYDYYGRGNYFNDICNYKTSKVSKQPA